MDVLEEKFESNKNIEVLNSNKCKINLTENMIEGDDLVLLCEYNSNRYFISRDLLERAKKPNRMSIFTSKIFVFLPGILNSINLQIFVIFVHLQ